MNKDELIILMLPKKSKKKEIIRYKKICKTGEIAHKKKQKTKTKKTKPIVFLEYRVKLKTKSNIDKWMGDSIFVVLFWC